MTTPKKGESASPPKASPEKPIDLRPMSRVQPINLAQYAGGQCSERDVQMFKLVFDMINTKGDGMITPFQIRKALSTYGGYKANRKEIYKIIACWDIDLSGEISFYQFMRMMTEKLCQNQSTADIQKVFRQVDREGKGYILGEDLKDLAEDLGQEMSDQELRQIMKMCDPNGQGRISKESFIAFNRQSQF